VTGDRFIQRMLAITVCIIGLALTCAYIISDSEALKEPLLLVLGALLAALHLGKGDEPVRVVDATDYSDPNKGTSDL
jgi:hypothetical protein